MPALACGVSSRGRAGSGAFAQPRSRCARASPARAERRAASGVARRKQPAYPGCQVSLPSAAAGAGTGSIAALATAFQAGTPDHPAPVHDPRKRSVTGRQRSHATPRAAWRRRARRQVAKPRAATAAQQPHSAQSTDVWIANPSYGASSSRDSGARAQRASGHRERPLDFKLTAAGALSCEVVADPRREEHARERAAAPTIPARAPRIARAQSAQRATARCSSLFCCCCSRHNRLQCHQPRCGRASGAAVAQRRRRDRAPTAARTWAQTRGPRRDPPTCPCPAARQPKTQCDASHPPWACLPQRQLRASRRAIRRPARFLRRRDPWLAQTWQREQATDALRPQQPAWFCANEPDRRALVLLHVGRVRRADAVWSAGGCHVSTQQPRAGKGKQGGRARVRWTHAFLVPFTSEARLVPVTSKSTSRDVPTSITRAAAG